MAVKNLTPQEQAAQAMARLQSYRSEMVASERAASAGEWLHVPEGYERWVIFRAGVHGDPRAEEIAYTLTRMGYSRCPSEIRHSAFLRDNGRGIYLWAPPELDAELMADKARRIEEKKRRARGAVTAAMVAAAGGRLVSETDEESEVIIPARRRR